VHDDNKASKARISLDAMTKPYDTNTNKLVLQPSPPSEARREVAEEQRLSMTLATYYYVSSVSSVSSYVSSRAGRQSAYLLRKKCSNIRLNSSSTTDTDWNTIEKIAASLKDGKYKRVLIVAGAGVSCSAGIPDFRTPGTGIYDNLQQYNLPYPEAIFDVDFYRHNPMPFVTLSKEIWPGVKYRPTLTHCFFSLLGNKNMLQRVYTQNIDGLEAIAGVHPNQLVECHGHFRSATCIPCGTVHDANDCKRSMIELGEAPKCKVCDNLVKPDVVFFGEVMPNRFSDLIHSDVSACDLVIVLGTSLQVAPVANIPDWVKRDVPRLLINREKVGSFQGNYPSDVFMEGDCDESIQKLCQMADWEKELNQIYLEVH
jgi:NAD-dependent SIR2 family protein deacetylase